MAYVVTFTNHKGGVGKTTSVDNVAAGLVARGRRVCMIDTDPQANLTQAGGATDAPVTLEDLLLAPGHQPPPTSVVEVRSGASLIPTSGNLATITDEFRAHPAYEQGLGRVIAPIEDRFDIILIDTPPGINQWSGLALLASDGVVIPARPSDFDVSKAAETWDFVEAEVRTCNPEVEILGVLITQTQGNRRMFRQARDAFGRQEMHVFDNWIPSQESVLSYARHGEPTVLLEPKSRAGRAYGDFTDELLAAIDARTTR